MATSYNDQIFKVIKENMHTSNEISHREISDCFNIGG